MALGCAGFDGFSSSPVLHDLAAEDLAGVGSPPIDRVSRIFDPGEGEVDLAELISRSAKADVVFLGEIHTDETTHRLQLWILMQLAAARGGEVVLAMEQFERDSQAAIDEYLAGSIDEPTFRKRARLWANYDADYRPLIEFAKARGLAVVASNAATPVRRKLAMEGRKAFDALSDDERKLVAKEMLPHTDAYWKRVEEATSGHGAMGLATPDDADAKLFSGQSVWDNTMAESIALSLERWPSRLVVHVNGGFHSEYFDGTVSQLKKRAPEATVITIATEPVDDLFGAEPPQDPSVASFVALVARIAASAQDDLYTVRVDRDFEFRVFRPSGVKTPPLLVCLPEEGVSTSEAETRYRARFGKHAAIVTIVPPVRDTGADFGESGRFFGTAGSFSNDLELAVNGTRGAVEYVLRRFDVDPARVVVVGTGDAARVAVAAALDARFPLRTAIALEPGAPGRLAELGSKRESETPARSVRAMTTPAATEAWTAETQRQHDLGLDATTVAISEDPWQRSRQWDEMVHDALLLPCPPAPAERRHIVLSTDSPRARIWAQTLAARHGEDQTIAILSPAEASARGEDLHASTPIDVTIAADSLRRPHAIPRAPGAFGGTTLVVVPADATDRDAWLALEKDDPLNKESRFHRLRVAFDAGGPSLDEALARLKEEGRKNVMIVPATFCADGEAMHALKTATTARAAEMTLSFSPGLGGTIVPTGAVAAPKS